jgi:hypothetical protein
MTDTNPVPCRGDIRPARKYPEGTPLSEIHEFEVWDGTEWVSSSDCNKPYKIQIP